MGQVPMEAISLIDNFRNCQSVVSKTNTFFREVFPQISDPIQNTGAFQQATCSITDQDVDCDYYWLGCENSKDEGYTIARVVEEILASDRGKIAILVSNREHFSHVYPHLVDAGIEISGQSIERLWHKPYIQDYYALLRALWHPDDHAYWVRLLKWPLIGLTWDEIAHIADQMAGKNWKDALFSLINDPTVPAQARKALAVIARHDLEARQDLDGFLQLHNEVFNLWVELAGHAILTDHEFNDVLRFHFALRNHIRGRQIIDLDESVEALKKLRSSPPTGQVQVMTVHHAKGLEFDNVIIPSCNTPFRLHSDDLLYHIKTNIGGLICAKPASRITGDRSLYRLAKYWHGVLSTEEEKRLFYVSCTRAKRRIFLTGTGDQDSFKKNTYFSLVADSLHQFEAITPQACPTIHQNDDEIVSRFVAPDWQDTVAPVPVYMPTTVKNPSQKEFTRQKKASPEYSLDIVTGILYHRIMERACNEHDIHWLDSHRDAIWHFAVNAGCPIALADICIDECVRLAKKTFSSPNGQKIVAPYAIEENEYAVSGFVGGKLTQGEIDRLIVNKEGRAFIVDYKTWGAYEPDFHADLALDVADVYRDQLDQYAALIDHVQHQSVTRLIYFPAGDFLVEF